MKKLSAVLFIYLSAVVILPVIILLLCGSLKATGSAFSYTVNTGALEYRTVTGSITRLFDEYSETTERLAAQPLMLGAAAGNDGDIAAAADLMKSYITTGLDVIDITVTTREGVIIFDASGKTPAGDTFFGWNDDVAELGKTSVYRSDIIPANTYGVPAFCFGKLLRHNNNNVGYIFLTVGIRGVSSYITEGASENEKLGIIDRNGTGIYSNNICVTEDRLENPLYRNIVTEIKGKRNSNSDYEQFSFGETIGNYGNVGNSDWVWITLYPYSEVQVTAAEIFFAPAVTIVIISMILLALGFVIAHSVNLRRLKFNARLLQIADNSELRFNLPSQLKLMPSPRQSLKNDSASNRNMPRLLLPRGQRQDEYLCVEQAVNDMIDECQLYRELNRSVSEIGDILLFEWDCVKEKLYVSERFKEYFDIDTERATLLNGEFIDSIMTGNGAVLYKEAMLKLVREKQDTTFEAELRTFVGRGSEHISMNVSGEPASDNTAANETQPQSVTDGDAPFNADTHTLTVKQDQTLFVSVALHCVVNRVGHISKIIGIMTNIDVAKKAELRLVYKANFDFLSKMYNRPTFEKKVSDELSVRAMREVAVMFIDIDNFKKVNDTYGHPAGDEIIVFIADSIRQITEGHGFGGRFGGDEFVICINNDSSIPHTFTIAENLIKTLGAGFQSEVSGIYMKVTGSIGIAVSPGHGTTEEELIEAADKAMYTVKKHGKCGVKMYDASDKGKDENE